MTTRNYRDERVRQVAALGKEASPNPVTVGPRMRRVFVKFPTRYGEQKESLWAQEVSPDTVRITNIPSCTTAVGSDDLVRTSPSGEVAEVLERVTRTRHARFEPANDPKEATRQWQLIEKHLA